MQYRKFGRLDWDVSILGFGAMRLPFKGDVKNIDEKEATRMLHYAIDQGVNYVDTAYPYHGGESEKFLERALRPGYRNRVKIASKMPSWLVNSPADLDKFFNEQLKRLNTEHIEFYLLHNLNKDYWAKLQSFDILEWGERALQAGKIGQFGFSFHDNFDLFKQIVDAWDWPFCQIQYNYMDVRIQAGTRGLKYAASKGMAVIVMEPILGGKLVNPPTSIQKIWDRAKRKRTAADWALQWVWNQAEVTVVLSGMSTFQQVVENIESVESAGVDILDEQEQELIRQVRKKYTKIAPIPCTRCGYCMPCPHGVDIPQNLNLYNEGCMYSRPDLARRGYSFVPQKARSDACTQCRECEPKCPQNILISEWMPLISEVLGQGKSYPE
jgi:predicted aldo/keto reductase-like oxidoreductase